MGSNVFLFGPLDVAELTFYLFVAFFLGLLLYLRREDRREGYPLEADTTGRPEPDMGLLFFPPPKAFEMPHGGARRIAPTRANEREVAARRTAVWPGAPLVPTGDPLVDGVGPASYALRADTPDRMHDGSPKIVPMAAAPDFHIAAGDRDPRGWTVLGCDRKAAGAVRELWVDRMEHLIRYLELELIDAEGRGTGVRKLLPMTMAVLDASARRINVRSIRSDQFARVPDLKQAGQITFLEEDRIVGYYGGGYLYALPSRQEPWL